jgi:hypothetical protein
MLEAIVTVAFVEIDGEGSAYPATQVQRVEFEGDVKVPSIKTPGGQYLIRREDILAILDLSARAA